jgi:hypothetical protein
MPHVFCVYGTVTVQTCPQAELKRLYTQLEVLKNKTIRADNPHISKRRGGRKVAHRRFSLQVLATLCVRLCQVTVASRMHNTITLHQRIPNSICHSAETHTVPAPDFKINDSWDEPRLLSRYGDWVRAR